MPQPIKVLLIEDNRIEARMTRHWLSEAKHGSFDVECVEKLSLGLERLKKGGIEIVLLDLNLPDSRGISTFLTLHDLVPEVPVVVLTGEYDDTIGPEAVEKGAQDYVVKQSASGASLSHVLLYALLRSRASLEKLQNERRCRQSEFATAVQKQMLPRSRPSGTGYDFADYYKPAENVGGDYFGYYQFPDQRIAISIGDVCGKGLTAALTVAELSSEVRHCLEKSQTAEIAMARINRQFCGREIFITFMLCILDPIQHTLTVVNAGHAPPLRRDMASGRSERLQLAHTSLPLGIDLDEVFQADVFDIESGDMFVLYTDGINEMLGESNELFGHDKLMDSLRQAQPVVGHAMQKLIRDMDKFRGHCAQSDDMCLVGFSRSHDFQTDDLQSIDDTIDVQYQSEFESCDDGHEIVVEHELPGLLTLV